MKVIAESFLRDIFRKGIPRTFTVEEGQILTPSAAQLLSEKRVEIVMGKKNEALCDIPAKEEKKTQSSAGLKYVSAIDGGVHETKPEHMTQLHGRVLVPKDHPRIFFRGKLDSLQSKILVRQRRAHENKNEKLLKDLGGILDLARAIMKADVLDEPLEENKIIGLTEDELRAQSHNPKKYFGIGHLIPEFDMSETVIGLNMLRTSVRETEVAAVKAFRSEFGIKRQDILQTLNRMSSAVYIMMLKDGAGLYK